MSKLWSLAILFVLALAPPKPFRFRILLDAPPALAEDSRRVTDALTRGLFMDSLLALGPERPPYLPSTPVDSATRANLTRTMLIRGSVAEVGHGLEIRLQVQNILMQTVAGPDTLRVERTALDSAVLARGRHYAQLLAKGRF
jgi:hypothetical protein